MQPDPSISVISRLHTFRTAAFRSSLDGGLAGLVGGVFVGAAESIWCASMAADPRGFAPLLSDHDLLWWGPLAYGILFACFGLVLGGMAALAKSIFRRPNPTRSLFPFCLGATLAAGVAVVLRWRLYTDFGRSLENSDLGSLLIWLIFLAGAAATWLVVTLAPLYMPSALGRRRPIALGAAVGLATLAILAGRVSASLLGQRNELTFTARTRGNPAPNILLVVADTLRADFLRLYNPQAVAKTPSLDALAVDGVVFQHCFSQSSWTKPAFGTIFTSLYPADHTATSHFAVLPERVTTLAEVLLNNGFFTRGFGNNPHVHSYMNFDQGFVRFTDLRGTRSWFDPPPSATRLVLYRRIMDKLSRRLAGPSMNVHDFYQPASGVTTAALQWLDDDVHPTDVPFHLMLHYLDPHDPYMGGKMLGNGYARSELGHPDPNVFRRSMVDAYVGDIEFMDRHLGRLFEGLRTRGLYDNTVIVFTSDHGEEFHDHKGWWHGNTLYDELTVVPLIIKLQNSLRGGDVNSNMARHIDLAPTVLHLVGIAPPSSMQGRCLLDSGGSFLNADIAYSISETDVPNANWLTCVRTIDAKLIHCARDAMGRFDPVEFYDLSADPRESTNRVGLGDPREHSLRALLGQLGSHFGEPGKRSPSQQPLPEGLGERLRTLGYF